MHPSSFMNHPAFDKLETKGKQYPRSDPVKNCSDLKEGKKKPTSNSLLFTCCLKRSSKLSNRHPQCCAEEQSIQVVAEQIRLQ